MNLPLNIDWQQILLHLFNFVLLFGILYILLYKPVKDFMEKRTEYYKKMDEDAKLNLEASEKTKTEYKEKLAAIDDEISEKKEAANKELEKIRADKLKQAEAEAEKIINDAHQTMEREHAKMIRDAQSEISGMVVTAAEKVILRANTTESFEQFLDTVEGGGKDE